MRTVFTWGAGILQYLWNRFSIVDTVPCRVTPEQREVLEGFGFSFTKTGGGGSYEDAFIAGLPHDAEQIRLTELDPVHPGQRQVRAIVLLLPDGTLVWHVDMMHKEFPGCLEVVTASSLGKRFSKNPAVQQFVRNSAERIRARTRSTE